ncbi:RusA family crossover junction endodeoxyribonuclease [Halorhodospira sp. 9622]|uniref:RusA family crossover junction endodeoxyribonuclease n=1 Tax=Halorhodospira sp. 9622 TaxID=2899136 RepID=UPI001EE8B405|nr:RusA family crossover junction endodeoxyribonuclease [Halorhodospira sp. 9622]MCG5538968.1 RusA family crossover junction endodeoxyribonuclease [Halorhodospira sp. 9622]
MELTLPWPPSVNTYWRHVPKGGGVRSLISRRGREYRGEVASAVVEALAEGRPAMMRRAQDGARLEVTIEAYPPDRRRRDCDNFAKAVLDSLEHAGVYADDSQIDELHILRRGVEHGGRVIVRIEEVSG